MRSERKERRERGRIKGKEIIRIYREVENGYTFLPTSLTVNNSIMF